MTRSYGILGFGPGGACGGEEAMRVHRLLLVRTSILPDALIVKQHICPAMSRRQICPRTNDDADVPCLCPCSKAVGLGADMTPVGTDSPLYTPLASMIDDAARTRIRLRPHRIDELTSTRSLASGVSARSFPPSFPYLLLSCRSLSCVPSPSAFFQHSTPQAQLELQPDEP